MNNISQFNSKETIQAIACDWIAAIDRSLTEQEENELHIWMHANPSHQKMLFDMAALWDEMSVMNRLKDLSGKQLPVAKPPKTRKWLAAAAMVAITLTGLLSWQLLPEPLTTSSELAATQQSSTLVGEQKTVMLADGSRVFLNTNTEIRVSFFSDARQVELVKGEAHFDVAKDPQRPFTVSAGANAVTAVGTAFNMQFTEASAFELTVTEGKVRVSKRLAVDDTGEKLASKVIEQEGVMIFAGEKVSVGNEVSAKESLTQSEIAQSLAWQDGQIVFTGEKLADALEEISRYTQVRFVIDDTAIENTRVAGYFRVGDINGLLAALESSFDIDSYEADDKTIHLRSVQGI